MWGNGDSVWGTGTERGERLRQCWVSSGASASPRLPRICLEEQGRKMHNSRCQLLPKAPALGYTKTVRGFVLGDSQTLSFAAALWGKKE